MTPPRNRYVTRMETGHPGFKNTIVSTTAEDLRSLARELEALASENKGRITHYVTEEHHPASLGGVIFEVISETRLAELQQPSTTGWLHRQGSCLVLMLVLGLALYGGVSLVTRLMSFLASSECLN